MVDPLEGGDARDAAAAARLRRRDEVKDLFNAGMEQRHRAHDTGFVRDEEGESCQEVLRTVLGRFFPRLDRGRWSLGAIVGDLADDVERGVAEGVSGGRTRVVPEKRPRELLGVLIWYRDVRDDG